MADALGTVLSFVAEGRLTSRDGGPSAATSEPPTEPASAPRGSASALRIEVTDKGRKVVNLRIPIPLGRMALDRIPGLAGNHVDMVRQALADGRTGTLLVLDDDGDGVRIALE